MPRSSRVMGCSPTAATASLDTTGLPNPNPIKENKFMHNLRLFATGIALALSAAIHPAQAQIAIEPTNENGEVVLIVDFEVKEGSETEFEEYFRRSVTCSRSEPGNVAFNIHKVVDQQNDYVLYEIWRDTEALERHFEQPYTKALFEMFDRTLVRPVTEGGLRFISDLDPAPREQVAAKSQDNMPADCG
ncbi:antibiotic biosynthesis monooxygenase family protein [uncultured Nitratireductor sp.]|mgnify:CR=1 FL=1|uniref:putative quinol monooxygenase n=1 Tax=uncultured Nitratireductor sp. TaxID=520953 RepID=UPI0025E28CCD|nr:antibiotic biosynthesis monooxygenase family protein [uncultured Nitratireductor sp.]